MSAVAVTFELQSGQLDQAQFGLKRVHRIHAASDMQTLSQVAEAVAEVASAQRQSGALGRVA